MARVIGPLMSVGARGTFDGTLTFRHRRGGTICGAKPVVVSKPTENQQYLRMWHQFAVDIWQSLFEYEREAWNSKAAGTGISGWNTFYQNFIFEYLRGVIPLRTPTKRFVMVELLRAEREKDISECRFRTERMEFGAGTVNERGIAGYGNYITENETLDVIESRYLMHEIIVDMSNWVEHLNIILHTDPNGMNVKLQSDRRVRWNYMFYDPPNYYVLSSIVLDEPRKYRIGFVKGAVGEIRLIIDGIDRTEMHGEIDASGLIWPFLGFGGSSAHDIGCSQRMSHYRTWYLEPSDYSIWG